MIFHENRLLADYSHEISYLFFQTMSQNLSSAAVVIGALRVRECHLLQILSLSFNQLKLIYGPSDFVTICRVGSHVVFVWIHWMDVRIHCTDILIECQ